MGGKVRNLGFTLLELLTVVVILSLSLLFFSKYNRSSGNKLVATSFRMCENLIESAKMDAIMSASKVRFFVNNDTASDKFRRQLGYCLLDSDGNWQLKREIILPDKTICLGPSIWKSFDPEISDQEIEIYTWAQENFSIRGSSLSVEYFELNSEGNPIDNSESLKTVAWIISGGVIRKNGTIYEAKVDNVSGGEGMLLLASGKLLHFCKSQLKENLGALK